MTMYICRFRSFRLVPSLLLVGFGFFLIAGPVWGQESTDADKKVSIEIGTTSLPARAEQWFRAEASAFAEMHPNISIELTAVGSPIRPFESTIEKLPKLAANVICIQTLFDDELGFLIENEMIVPLDTFEPESYSIFEHYPDSLLAPVVYDERTWGMPLLSDTFFLMLDKELLANAGITEPPKTWAEFNQYLKRLTVDTDQDGRIDQYGLYIPQLVGVEIFLWLTILGQAGVTEEDWIGKNPPRDALTESLEVARELLNSPYVERSFAPTFGSNGPVKSAMGLITNLFQYLPAVSEPMRMLMRSRKFVAAPFPAGKNDTVAAGYRIYLAVRKSTPEQESASWEFVKWMSRRDIAMPDHWFGYPCRSDIADSATFQVASTSYCEGVADVITSLPRNKPVTPPWRSEKMLELRSLIRDVLLGTGDLTKAVDRLIENTDEFFIGDRNSIQDLELLR